MTGSDLTPGMSIRPRAPGPQRERINTPGVAGARVPEAGGSRGLRSTGAASGTRSVSVGRIVANPTAWSDGHGGTTA